MITTRTRILSILATVAMLVSMLACFVIPASAIAEDYVGTDLEPYAALLEDVTGATNLSTALSPEAEVSTLVTALDQDKTDGNITWPTYGYVAEGDTTSTNRNFPRYAHKAVYEAAGYADYDADKTEWSITKPADWEAMVTASAADDFMGEVFHVTEDVDFTGVTTTPLNYGENALKDTANYPFNGTIEGHGNAFKEIDVQVTVNYSGKQCVTGMIGKLGPYAKIKNFGVDSGKIEITKGEVSSLTVATFGEAVNKSGSGYTFPSSLADQHAELYNVWSGAQIIATGATVAGIESHSQNSYIVVNGAYFFGTLQGDTVRGISSSTNTLSRYNVLCNTTTTADMIGGGDDRGVSNILYSVGSETTNPISTSYTGTILIKGNVDTAEQGAWEINSKQPAKEYEYSSGATDTDGTTVINKKETGDLLDPVYFTITGKDATTQENIIRPTGTAENCIVKVTVAGVDDPLYVNLDTQELTKDYLVGLTGNDAITGYVLNGGDPVAFTSGEDYIELAADSNKEAIITFTVNAEGALEDAITKYTALQAYGDYLTPDAVTAIGTFMDNATAATLEEDEKTLIAALETYATYPTEGDKKIPGYTLKSVLGEYNVHTGDLEGKQVWAISEVEDWTDMIAASKYDADTNPEPETFANHIFHVTDNINFDTNLTDEDSTGIVMEPLNFGSGTGDDGDTTAPFQGTIEGNGFAFQNINVQETVNTTSKKNASAGLIGKFGADARIKNFGVDSGTIYINGTVNTVDGSSRGLYVSTFGDPISTAGGERLTKVWSGATIIADAEIVNADGEAAEGSNIVSGIVAQGHDSGIIVNGAYFFGKLQAADGAYGMYHQVKNEQVYNALSKPEGINGTEVLAANKLYNTDLTYTGTYILNNVYGVGETLAYQGYDGSVENPRVLNSGTAETAGEGAWLINKNQAAIKYTVLTEKDADTNVKVYAGIEENGTVDAVYFSYNENGDIRFGEEANRIVRYNVTINEQAKDPVYANAGSYTADELKTLLKLYAGNGVTITGVTQGDSATDVTPDADNKYGITEDVVNVTVNYDDEALCAVKTEELQTYIDAYDAYDANLVVDGEKLTTFKNAVAAIEETAENSADRVNALDVAIAAGAAIAENEKAVLALNTTLDYPNFPAYKDHALYEKYADSTITNWLILDKDDWKAMDDYANKQAEGASYFEGVTFHLKDNVDFGHISAWDDDVAYPDGTTDAGYTLNEDYMRPLGGKGASAGTVYRKFAGTINGHGYGFENIYVVTFSSGTSNTTYGYYNAEYLQNYAGLIGFLGDCELVNFGINSGAIEHGTSDAKGNSSSFGCVVSNTETTAPAFTRVWSNAKIIGSKNGPVSTLAGIYNNQSDCTVTVNGFVFEGTITKSAGKRDAVYGVIGGNTSTPAATSTYTNILSYPTVSKNIYTYLFGGTGDGISGTASNIWGYKKATGNAAGLGLEYDYRNTTTGLNYADGAATNITGAILATDSHLTEMSIKAAAYDLNVKQATETDETKRVYFTLVNGKIRPTVDDDNRIVKYTITENNEGVEGEPYDVYYNAGAIKMEDLGLETGSGISFAVNGGEATETATATIAEDENTIYVTITKAAGQIAALEAALAEYDLDNLNLNYFKTTAEINVEGKIGLGEFVEMANNALATETGLDAAVAAIETVVPEIKGADGYPNLPAYKDHEAYDAYQPTNANWLIVDPEDWYAMDAFANAQAEGDYFVNTTFHLIDDVDFDDEEAMMPLGIQTTNKMTFAGIIDGHNYGFENITINTNTKPLDNTYFMKGDDTIKESIGLIGFLGDGCIIQNFGVNSGTIYGQTGNAGVSVSTFGTVAAGATANFNKVWSGVKLQGASNPFISPLAGIDTNADTCKVNVDGFTFYGKASKSGSNYQYLYGIMGGVSVAPAADSSFANIITYPTTQADKYTYLFGAGLADLSGYTISNVYGIKKADTAVEGIGFEFDYRTGTGSKVTESNPDCYAGNTTDNVWVKDMTAFEAAHEVNTDSSKNTGVYFKLVDGNIRPTGTASEYLVKVNVTIDGTADDYYLNLNQVYTLADLAAALGLTAKKITEVAVTTGAEYTTGTSLKVIADEAIFAITTAECDHAGYKTHIDGKEKHTIDCSVCGYEGTESCSITYEIVGEVTNNVITSTGSCSGCGYDQYTKECTGTPKGEDNDCTTSDVLEFTCDCTHHDKEVNLNNAQVHSFNEEEWTIDETTGLKYHKCVNGTCSAKKDCVYEAQLGVDDAENIKLKALANGNTYDITIDLPDNLASADLTFTFSDTANYSIEKVMQGTEITANDGVYTVTGSTSVVVTVKSTLAAVGCDLTVEVANATASDTPDGMIAGETVLIEITVPTVIAIQLDAYKGDVDGDNDVDLGDALDALYYYAGLNDSGNATGETVVINTVNADFNDKDGFNLDDVYAIVQYWLGERIKQLTAK